MSYSEGERELTFANNNKKYVVWNVYLPNALHSVCLNRLSCTEVGIYNGVIMPFIPCVKSLIN